MSVHTAAAARLASVPVCRPGESKPTYADRLREWLPKPAPRPFPPFGQPLPPPSRAELEAKVAKEAADLICAMSDLWDILPESERLAAKPRASNGRSREAYREAQRQYMANKRAKDREAKAPA